MGNVPGQAVRLSESYVGLRWQVNFIIKSKALAFITAGLFSGAIGFIKLYLCATKWDIHGPGSCEEKGTSPRT